jgi:DNA-binding NarL/FixJ family response regulator
MAEPRDYPTVRYWPDGRFVLVDTPMDYAELEPGHADNPGGPFPSPETPEASLHPEQEAPTEEQESRQAHARRLYAQGVSRHAIAETLGVSPRTVGRLLGES